MATVLFIEFVREFEQMPEEKLFFHLYWQRFKYILGDGLCCTASNYLLQEPPYWIMHLASNLRSSCIDYSVSTITYTIHNQEHLLNSIPKQIEGQLKKAICENSPQVIALSPITVQYEAIRTALGIIKQLLPSSRIVLGGPHATFLDHDCLMDGADVVCHGEFDQQFSSLVLRLLHSDALHDFPGISFLADKNTLTKTQENIPPVVTELPPPRFEIFATRGRALPYIRIFTQRGCARNCAFCANTIWKNSEPRFKSVENVAAEISDAFFAYGQKPIFLADETFTQNWGHAKSIAELFTTIGVPWFVQTRPDLFNRAQARCLSECGCKLVSFGAESASNLVLGQSRKGFSIDTVVNASKVAKSYGLSVLTYWLVGLPGESYSTAIQTHDMMLELIKADVTDLVEYFIAIPYPGTDIYQKPESYGITLHDSEWSAFVENRKPCFSTESLSSEDILRLWKMGMKRIITGMEDNRI